MDGGHDRLLDADPPAHDLHHRGDAVGGAGGAGDHAIGFPRLGDPVDDATDLLALGGRRQDRVFGPGRKVFAQAIGPGEEPGAFKDDVHPQVLPGQLGRVPFAQIFNGFSRHLQGLPVAATRCGYRP